MNAIFYDRKNKRTVKASELFRINYVQHPVVVDAEEKSHGPVGDLPMYFHEEKIDEFGYKTEECVPVCNWNVTTSLKHLVFCDFEESV